MIITLTLLKSFFILLLNFEDKNFETCFFISNKYSILKLIFEFIASPLKIGSRTGYVLLPKLKLLQTQLTNQFIGVYNKTNFFKNQVFQIKTLKIMKKIRKKHHFFKRSDVHWIHLFRILLYCIT